MAKPLGTKRPHDLNQLAAALVGAATDEAAPHPQTTAKTPPPAGRIKNLD